MADGDGGDRNGGESEAGDGSETLGALARIALAAVAVALGIVWIARLAVGGPTFGDGLLFEVLPPLALLYFGSVVLRDRYEARERQ